MRLVRDALVSTAVVVASATSALACEARDFLNLPIMQTVQTAELQALILAYPALAVSPDAFGLILDDGTTIKLGGIRDVPPAQRLDDASLAEQFFYIYPLNFDLEKRKEPFVDPGRIRNEIFFHSMYFSDESVARASLRKVSGPEGTKSEFWMTEKGGVACQLEAAFSDIEALATDSQPYFREVGGSFNWRRISGTSRLSAHSYGISIDINAELGQYWKWTGAPEGNVSAYNNKVPEDIVRAMERYGFIWGGKWHHFDGMHFEYRPELIMYSRMVGPE